MLEQLIDQKFDPSIIQSFNDIAQRIISILHGESPDSQESTSNKDNEAQGSESEAFVNSNEQLESSGSLPDKTRLLVGRIPKVILRLPPLTQTQ